MQEVAQSTFSDKFTAFSAINIGNKTFQATFVAWNTISAE